MENILIKSFIETKELLEKFYNDPKNIEKVSNISRLISECFKNGNKVMIAGNGGSACDAMHFAEEFTGRFRKDRRALPAMAFSDPSHITCVGNDYGFDEIFAKGVEAFGKDGDIFIGISTSGNSKNIIKAIEKSRLNRVKTIGMLGKDGGKLKGVCDYEFIIEGETSDRIQEVHMTILHIIIEGVERLMFPENY